MKYYVKQIGLGLVLVVGFLLILSFLPTLIVAYHILIDMMLGIHSEVGMLGLINGFVIKALATTPLLYFYTKLMGRFIRWIVGCMARLKNASYKIDSGT